MTAWEDLLEEFRALGGTADNIRLGQGEFGRGIFPVDPVKRIAIRIPENLLVASNEMIFVNGVPRVGPAATVKDRERAWLDRYQEEFAWGGGGGDEVRQMFEMAGAIPEEVRHILVTQYGCGTWFAEPTNELIQKRFFETRTIKYRSKSVVMPLIELVNHGNGPEYDLNDGVSLYGTFAGEVSVQYSYGDCFDYFRSWGFATQRPVAFSVGLEGAIGNARLQIHQDFTGCVTSERSWIPDVYEKEGAVLLPFLLLGSTQFARLPRNIFYRLMRDAGYKGFEETFDMVRHLNRLHFIGLLDTLDPFDLPIARTLRAMARYQLRTMSFCIGVREI